MYHRKLLPEIFRGEEWERVCPEDVISKFNETPVNVYQNTLHYTPQDISDTYVTFSLSVLTHIY